MKGVSMRILAAAALLLPTAIVSGLAANREFHAKTVVAESTLPERMGVWESREVKLTETERSMLDAPAASQRVYTNPSTGDQVQVLLLQMNDTQNAHDPRLCMTGSGYQTGAERVVDCPWADSRKPYPVSRAEFEKGPAKITMYYWLQTPDGSVANMSSGLKWEGIRRALRGSTVKGVSVRLIALPHSDDTATPTDPKVAETLWRTMSQQIGLDGLIAKM